VSTQCSPQAKKGNKKRQPNDRLDKEESSLHFQFAKIKTKKIPVGEGFRLSFSLLDLVAKTSTSSSVFFFQPVVFNQAYIC